MKTFDRYQIATAIALLFHFIGLIGMLFFDKKLMAEASWINLFLMFILLLFTHKKIDGSFLFFAFVCIITGFSVELIGTNTGWLFGKYEYGNVLGPAYQGVPLIISINWFIIIYCCGITITTLLDMLLNKLAETTGQPRPGIKAVSIIVDGATLAVFFDWIMEPVAIHLNYWTWYGNDVPLFNYLCWFLISAVLLTVFRLAISIKKNKFAVNLLLIQIMFFLLLRTFL